MGTLKDPFPVAPHKSIVVGNDFVCLDGNWISTIRVTKRLETFHVSDVQKVYHHSTPPGTWCSTVTAGETISGDMETNVLVYQQRAGKGIREGLAGNQSVEHPKKAKRRRSLGQQAELMSSSSLAQQFNDVFCVIAPTREKMIQDRNRLLGTLKHEGYKCRTIKGRSRQLDAAITGTLGINRL